MEVGLEGEEEEEEDEEESEVFLKQMRKIERDRGCSHKRGKGLGFPTFSIYIET